MGLTPTGWDSPSLEEVLETMRDDLRAAISPTLNVSETSLVGQLLGVFASQITQVWEAGQANYAARDPNQASGDSLANLTRLVGVERNGATASLALMTVTLAAGTYPAGSLVVHVLGDPTARFYNELEITTAGATLTNQRFLSEETGPIRANSGTLTVIADPVAGFSAPTNPLDAELGAVAESDSDLRARWREQLARRGSGTVDAIRADVLQIADFVRVVENDTSTTVDGIPAHAFETLVLGGIDADIAEAIFATKPAGIQAYGSTVVTVTDAQGSGHAIGFTRPTDVDIYLDVTIQYLSGQYIGDDAIKLLLADWGDSNLGPGNDVIHNRLVQLLMDVPGVIDVSVAIDDVASPTTEANFVIGVREIARLDTSRIDVAATAVVGVP
jgi:uncharacterized phage protein gp47/JayE